MKYLYLSLCLVAAAGCSSKAESEKSYVCFNPIMPIASIFVGPEGDTSVGVKDLGQQLELTDKGGNVLVIPKSLCAELRKPGQN